MRRGLLVIAAISALFAAGCATNPVTGETEIRVISVADEIEMGRNIDARVRSQYNVVTGTDEARRVEKIGARVAGASDRRDIKYHFALIESPDLNAFAAPGGFIYVTTETVSVSGDDSELAAVIAHEVGHVAALHSVHQVQRHLTWS